MANFDSMDSEIAGRWLWGAVIALEQIAREGERFQDMYYWPRPRNIEGFIEEQRWIPEEKLRSMLWERPFDEACILDFLLCTVFEKMDRETAERLRKMLGGILRVWNEKEKEIRVLRKAKG